MTKLFFVVVTMTFKKKALLRNKSCQADAYFSGFASSLGAEK